MGYFKSWLFQCLHKNIHLPEKKLNILLYPENKSIFLRHPVRYFQKPKIPSRLSPGDQLTVNKI